MIRETQSSVIRNARRKIAYRFVYHLSAKFSNGRELRRAYNCYMIAALDYWTLSHLLHCRNPLVVEMRLLAEAVTVH